MKKIYFYSPGVTGELYRYRGQSLFVNTVPAYLNSALKQHRPDLAQQIQWTKIQLLQRTAQDIAQHINDHGIDIFCASLYIWNQYHVLEVIDELRTHVQHDIKIIVGGPSVDPHRDAEYFSRHPNIDFAAFAQGEQAFISALDSIVNDRTMNFFSAKNLAWPDATRTVKKSEYEFIKKRSGSPYLDSADILAQIAHDADYRDYKFYFPWETSKGCPYNCSFCDWTSGLSHKVSHRVENDWEAELDLLGRLDFVNIHISDANFGQHSQDIEIAKVMVRLKQERGYQFVIQDTNFSKLKKKESFAILDVLLSAGIIKNPKFAVQDTNIEVLANIERPDVPWPQHRGYILAMLERFPDTQCEIEIIQGLPGQTRETWKQTLLDVQGFTLRAYPWVMLPNAPVGYDADYRAKMQIQTLNVRMENLNDQPQEIIVATYSYDLRDYMYMTLLSKIVQTHLGSMQDRALLFARIDQCHHLDRAIDDLCDAFVGERPLSLMIYNLMDRLFEQYQDWPQYILDHRKKILGAKHATQ